LLRVQWKTPDDGQRNCPKHIEFYSKNKSEKLVHLVGFIIRRYKSNFQIFEKKRCSDKYMYTVSASFSFSTYLYITYEVNFSFFFFFLVIPLQKERFSSVNEFRILWTGFVTYSPYSDCKALCSIASWHSGDMIWNCDWLSSVPLDILLCSSCYWTCHEAGTASGHNCYGVYALVKESCLPRGSSEDCTTGCTGRKIREASTAATCIAVTSSDVSRNEYLTIIWIILSNNFFFFNFQVRHDRCVQ